MRIAAIALLVAALGGCDSPGGTSTPDPATLRTYAERYLSLLQAKDEPELRRHLGNQAQPGDAAKRIETYGGQGWTLADASWQEQTPTAFALSMLVDGPGGRTTWRHNVEWEGDRWIMGPLDPRPGGAATIRPS